MEFDFGLQQQCEFRRKILDVELSDAFASGLISIEEFQRQSKRLQQISTGLESISISKSRRSFHSGIRVLEIPVLNGLSNSEQEIVSANLLETGRTLQQVFKVSKKLQTLLHKIHRGELGWIGAIFSLSWQRRSMKKIVRSLDLLRKNRNLLEQFIQSTTRQGSSESANIDLIQTFKDFEVSTHRISKMRETLIRDRARILEQTRWLQKYRNQRSQSIRFEAPPISSGSLELCKRLDSKLNLSVENVNERLVVARKLLNVSSPVRESDLEISKPDLGNDVIEIDQCQQRSIRSKKQRILKKIRSHA
ncbi:MAG: hypothetical protein NT027_02695 [Proteobacteria bacterium]|nr:hypothetical protein [Pseudomonadota bacterium]